MRFVISSLHDQGNHGIVEPQTEACQDFPGDLVAKAPCSG